MLVEVFRVRTDYKDSRGKTGFVYVCEKNFLDIVKYILKINPNVIYQNDTQEQYIYYKFSGFSQACEKKSYEVIKFLIKLFPNIIY